MPESSKKVNPRKARGASNETGPRGKPATQTLAMPGYTNPSGDIFGGWVLAQMDIAGGIAAGQRTKSRVATVAIDSMTFHRPVHIGDVLCVFADIERIGRTSITLHLEAWVTRDRIGDQEKVTEGDWTYVALDDSGRPQRIARVPATEGGGE